MENQEKSAIITILNEMRQDMNKMMQSIDGTNKRIDSLDKKVDSLDKKVDSIETKFDNKFASLEKKVDNNSANIIKLLNITTKMQKDVEDLREDVETVYSLEKDSRKQLKRLL